MMRMNSDASTVSTDASRGFPTLANLFSLFGGLDALEAQYNELTEKYKQTQTLASNLQAQLASARLEVEDWKNEVNKIRAELEEQIRVLKSALEYSEAERKICEDKWQKEFEMLRTHNRGERVATNR